MSVLDTCWLHSQKSWSQCCIFKFQSHEIHVKCTLSLTHKFWRSVKWYPETYKRSSIFFFIFQKFYYEKFIILYINKYKQKYSYVSKRFIGNMDTPIFKYTCYTEAIIFIQIKVSWETCFRSLFVTLVVTSGLGFEGMISWIKKTDREKRFMV